MKAKWKFKVNQYEVAIDYKAYVINLQMCPSDTQIKCSDECSLTQEVYIRK